MKKSKNKSTGNKRITKKLQATGYHEAGHHAMKWHFGFSFGTLTIKPDRKDNSIGSSGHPHQAFKRETIQKLFDYKRPTPGQVRRIENYIMVCLAGREAERIFRPKKKRLCGTGGDYNQARIFLQFLVDKSSPQFPVYWKLLELRTRDILSIPIVWSAVEGLAKALLDRETLSGKESRKVIKEALAAKIKRIK